MCFPLTPSDQAWCVGALRFLAFAPVRFSSPPLSPAFTFFGTVRVKRRPGFTPFPSFSQCLFRPFSLKRRQVLKLSADHTPSAGQHPCPPSPSLSPPRRPRGRPATFYLHPFDAARARFSSSPKEVDFLDSLRIRPVTQTMSGLLSCFSSGPLATVPLTPLSLAVGSPELHVLPSSFLRPLEEQLAFPLCSDPL